MLHYNILLRRLHHPLRRPGGVSVNVACESFNLQCPPPLQEGDKHILFQFLKLHGFTPTPTKQNQNIARNEEKKYFFFLFCLPHDESTKKKKIVKRDLIT